MTHYLPLALSAMLVLLVVLLWPTGQTWGALIALRWLNIGLLGIAALALMGYGIRNLRGKKSRRTASSLRLKLVMALVTMLLLPAILLQGTASYVVNRGLDDWFDIKVESLLNRAITLGRGFYQRIDRELRQGLLETVNDASLRDHLVLSSPFASSDLFSYATASMQHHDWDSMQIFDFNEQSLVSVARNGLTLKADRMSDRVRLSLSLGKITIEPHTEKGREYLVGYAPVIIHQKLVAVVRATVAIPDGLMADARSVEKDYRKYSELSRHRDAMGRLFVDLMVLITLIVTVIAAWAAWIFARGLTRPVEQLASALERVSDGDLNVSLQVAGKDELGSLVHSFNIMSRKLKRNTEAVERTQSELRKALRDSQQRKEILENLLANLDSGVLLMNHQGEVELNNQAFVRLLEIPTEALQQIDVAQTLKTINIPASTARVQMVLHVIEEVRSANGAAVQRELDVSVEHGVRHLLVRGIQISGKGSSAFSGFLLVLDDLTEVAEAQRHRAWVEVARSVAHEIKNPLTPIKLAAERLQRRRQKGKLDDKVFEQCTQTIITQSNRLIRLTSDFSTLASLPRPRCTMVDARSLMDEIADLYAAYPRVQVILPATPYYCYADADQIRQVLINLMDNALSATEEGCLPVRLYVDTFEHYTSFHVEDEGEGIQLDNPQLVFDAYFSTKSEGSGLGLSISARIAREHEGELLLLSTCQPTHFCLRVPSREPVR